MVGYGETTRFFCLFFVCPCLISCKFEPLSRPIKLNRTCASFRALPAACHHACFVRPLSSVVKFATCCHCTSWTPKPPRGRGGYNSCGDAEKELNSLRCCAGGSGRAWRKCRQDERNYTASAPSESRTSLSVTFMLASHSRQHGGIDVTKNSRCVHFSPPVNPEGSAGTG